MTEPPSAPAHSEPAAAEEPVPAEGVTLEVSHAAVPAFSRALELARAHASFRHLGEGKNLRFRVTYSLADELDALQAFKEATWDLHHKRAFIDGREVTWAQMAQLTYCYTELRSHPRRDHCFFDGNFWNPWGCRYAVANLADRINTEWLHFGQLDPEGGWVFDKPRIAAHVRANLYQAYQSCPAFDAEFVDLVLEVFPERLHPTDDTLWGYIYNRQGEIVGVGPKDVGSAKKIVHGWQEKIRQRRGADAVAETGKRLPATAGLPAASPTPTPLPRGGGAPLKKGLLSRLWR